MKKQRAYCVGIHRYSYRAGEPALIIGVKIIKPGNEYEERACFHIKYEDGDEDFVPINEDTYKLISEAEKNSGKIPEVVL